MTIPLERKRRRDIEPDMAPLIDIVFLLLIFYMLTSSFAVPSALDLSLPEGGAPTSEVLETLVISVDRHGVLRVNGDEVEWDGVSSMVRARLADSADLRVRVEMDRGLAVARMVELLDTLQAAGVRNLDIATEERR